MKRGISYIVALALTLPLAGAWAVTFTSNTTIGAGDTTYDGQDIVVSGCTLTVNGPHAFSSLLLTNGGILTHSPAPNGEVNNRLDLTIAGNLTVPAGSSIDISGRGYGAARGPGAGVDGGGGWSGSGAGHGGLGSSASVPGGQAYGDPLQPVTLGSGGGNGRGSSGGAGGGALRLVVGGTLTLNGLMTANGLNGNGTWGGGGAGGSLWIEVGTLTGNGVITADGGNGGGDAGGGAGGRVALYYANSTFTGAVTAYGRSGHQGGGAGTVFRKVTSAPAGELLVDNGGNVYQITPITTPVALALAVANGGRAVFTNLLTLSALNVSTNGLLQHVPGVGGAAIHVTGDALITLGGQINLDGMGYPAASGPGAGVDGGGGWSGSGAGHGGLGSSASVPGGQAYGDPVQPVTLGSGGGNGRGSSGGAGGGALRLVVGGTLTVNGHLTANGLNGNGTWGGGGAGGSLWIEAGTLTGNGVITADGGNGGGDAGGGAGGRIALYLGTNSFGNLVTAYGGHGWQGGGAGTVFRKLTAEPAGELRVQNLDTNMSWTPLKSPQPYRLNLAYGARVYPETPLLLAGLLVQHAALLSHLPQVSGVHVTVSGDATVQWGGEINVDGCGAGPGSGYGAGTNVFGSGAGHGGVGGAACGAGGGRSYGVVWWPTDYGSGGGDAAGWPGGAGGGVIHLIVGGTLTVNGTISAEGANAPPHAAKNSGGGSGGSILIEATSVVGAAPWAISADGGDAGGPCGGGGAGGCIAIYHGGATDPGPLTSVKGGTGYTPGGLGTVWIYTNFTHLSVTTHLPNGLVGSVVDKVQVLFSSAVNPASFTSDDVLVITPSGPLPPGVVTVTPVGGVLFEIGFPPQSAPGPYQLQIGPQIQSLFGRGMDQNGNGTPGEVPGDVYAGTFTIVQPTISGTVSATNGWRLKNVTVRALDGSASATTDVNGNYTLTLAPGWSGSVVAELAGGAFSPPSRAYLDLQNAQTGQDFTLITGLQPALQVQRQGANVVVSWSSLACFGYQLRSSPDLLNWSDFGPPQPGNSGTLSVSVPATNTVRAFQVRVDN